MQSTMEAVIGVVQGDQVMLDDVHLASGTQVAVYVVKNETPNRDFALNDADKRELLASIAEAEGGEGMGADSHLNQLRAGAQTSKLG